MKWSSKKDLDRLDLNFDGQAGSTMTERQATIEELVSGRNELKRGETVKVRSTRANTTGFTLTELTRQGLGRCDLNVHMIRYRS